MSFHFILIFILVACFASLVNGCDVSVRIESGWVSGACRLAEGEVYASFRGIPYAEQPVGKYRFKELRPKVPWKGYLNATTEGPVCPQYDETYGRLVYPHRAMSEACIHVNVHVPLAGRSGQDLATSCRIKPKPALPILVFVHGGGFQSGSGDADVHGPEYFITKGIIVITFNYRINIFGYLSLDTPEIPGNNGLRDVVTLLQWVQRNAQAFGGDPQDITLAGQSAGAAMAHLVSLSNVSKGLFNRLVLMSGTGFPNFYSASKTYAQRIANMLLTTLGINSTDPVYIHKQLIKLPLKHIMEANRIVQAESLVSFVPVVESQFHGVTRIVDADPTVLIEQGRGEEYPTIIGFTNVECEFFRKRFKKLNILERLKSNPEVILPQNYANESPRNVTLLMADLMKQKYFHGEPTLDQFLRSCSHALFQYPAFKLARQRATSCGAPVYLYKYSYESQFNAVKLALGLNYKGAAHVEDLTYLFRQNAVLGRKRSFPPKKRDDYMKDWLTSFFVNFTHCSDPTCNADDAWPPLRKDKLRYQLIEVPAKYINRKPNDEETDMIKFFDNLEQINRNATQAGHDVD